ncbi:MAG: SNF2-related protein [Acidobacteriota bacterium]
MKPPPRSPFDLEPMEIPESDPPSGPEFRWQHLYDLLESGSEQVLDEAEQALAEFPSHPTILFAAALAALVVEHPERCLRYLKRLAKRWVPRPGELVLQALAEAQQRRWSLAANLLAAHGLDRVSEAAFWLPRIPRVRKLVGTWIGRIHAESARLTAPPPPKAAAARAPLQARTTSSPAPVSSRAAPAEPAKAVPARSEAPPGLPRFNAEIPVRLALPAPAGWIPAARRGGGDTAHWFRLRSQLARLGLALDYDELMCLPHLLGVDTYWYQVETVRKVLRQYHGRVLLADEVGLGKTIEAGMVLKEYLLRGMVEKVLILTPASLVGQWREEMESKFFLELATTEDALLRSDPKAFWRQPRIIASIAAARREEHAAIVGAQSWDLVVVDEAHHLKNRSTANWKLVDGLQRRFLLLLSATPVQNSLVELYNLLTLLKPGIFKTEREFRAQYMRPGKPRQPANRERLRTLMRDVMIRNTRSLVDVRLPPRHALTSKLAPSEDESACYEELSVLVQAEHRVLQANRRLVLRHLLAAAGSAPAAARAAIASFTTGGGGDRRWHDLHARYRELSTSVKEEALLGLLRRNPEEKKMVFAHHRATLESLEERLAREGICLARFDGSLSGPDKDAAVARFRDSAPVLLCSQSGGEGRNLQFCNTLINFDLPWNPMAIEQRIGRIHRIGQQREVFVFNLAVRNTLEEHLLTILEEKIHMFELVVGEIDVILGELDESQDFSELVYAAWVGSTQAERPQAFAALGDRLAAAKHDYEAVKALDGELFGDDLEVG